MAKRKTDKRGARFGNKHGREVKRMVNLEFLASLEGVSHQSFSQKLKRLEQSLPQYIANLIKDYGEGFELGFSELAASNTKKMRTVTLEAFAAEALKKIYEENPQLKSQRKKPNSLNQDLQG